MNPLHHIMGINEASKKWGLPPDVIIQMCRAGKLQAIQLDMGEGAWVLLKDQAAPNTATPDGPEIPRSQAPARPAGGKTSGMSSRLRDALYE